MIDVLILYEHRNREIENACLLSTELRRRGYKTDIQNIYSLKKYFLCPKVVIVPHLYNESQLISFAKNYKRKNVAIIDLQYEQVLANSDTDGVHNPCGQARYAHHIAWGKAQEVAYLKHGISPERVHTTGHMAMDLLRPEFEDYFMSKDELAIKYHIDKCKTWVLFISSFSLVGITEEKMKQFEAVDKNIRRFAKYSEESCKEILRWFEEIIRKNPEMEFVYRKHPAENQSLGFDELEQRYKNFHCIDGGTVRQWVKVADKIYTWYSTSIVDVFFAKKMCYILRPKAIDSDLELSIMDDAKKLTSLDEFEASLIEAEAEFPIKASEITYYYGENEGKMAYVSIADLCEKMMDNEEKGYLFDFGSSAFDMCNTKSFKRIVGEYIYRFIFEVCKYIKIPIPNLIKNKKLGNKVVLYQKEAYRISNEIKEYKKRMEVLINKNE